MQQNILGATSKGLFSLPSGTSQWARVTGYDTNACSKVFCNRLGNLYVGTTNRGTFFSSNQGTSWVPDTAGIKTQSVAAFGDDAFGTNYIITLSMGANSLFRKTTSSVSWERIDTNLRNYLAIALSLSDAGGDSTLEVATNYCIYTSTNSGNTWIATFEGMTFMENADIFTQSGMQESPIHYVLRFLHSQE